MPTAIHGKRLIYFFRPLSKVSEYDGKRIFYSKENEKSMSVDADTTATKDGPIRAPGSPEIEITSTSVLAKGDTLIGDLQDAMLKGEKVSCWEVNLDEPAETGGKYKATYYEGFVTEVTISSPSDDWTEVSVTYGAEGTGAAGEATVSDEQLDEALYVFKDLAKQGA